MDQIPSYFKVDTLLRKDGILIRHSTKTVADTLSNKAIKRGELKIYDERCMTKVELEAKFKIINKGYQQKLINSYCAGTSKPPTILFIYLLIGLFIGSLLHFLSVFHSTYQES
jgi:hypothetical protein